MELQRREFMKLAAMTAATGLAGSMASRGGTAWASTQPPLPDQPDIPGVNWHKAPCRFCGTGCHVQVGVQDDKVVAIAGDRQADVNKGLLCVKGYHVGMILYGADRLTKPMARRDGELVEIEWDEAIDIARIRTSDGIVIIEFPHYDSVIEARIAADGRTLIGEWNKTRGKNRLARVPFRAQLGDKPRFVFDPDSPNTARLDRRFRVAFSSSDDPAVGVFDELDEVGPGGVNLAGTILTTTGDYRYLAGRVDGDRVQLSCFDGAHAFLLTGTLDADGSIAGDFSSGDWWHETWSALPDPDASLPDAFTQTSWNEEADLSELVFKDLMGNPVSLADEQFAGKPMLIKVTGSWCPNCNDAAPFIAQLDRTYRDRGLVVVALAFELTGEFERDARQVRRFVARHEIEFPVLIAGIADKARASEQFPVLDRVRAYPTTIFADRA